MIQYLFIFIIAIIVSYFLTKWVRRFAIEKKIYDLPAPRKIHHKPIARLGGAAIFLTFIILIALVFIYNKNLISFSKKEFFGPIDIKFFGVFLGSLVLFIVGIFDDVKSLKPEVKFVWQLIAAMVLIVFGVTLDYIRNPFGGFIFLNHLNIPIAIFGHPFQLVFWSSIFIIFWVVLMINVVNWLDGLDGLAAGVCFIAFVILFFLSLRPEINQASLAILCVIFAGALIGFLTNNFYPAKIFMGDSGSMILGYYLAVFSILSGAKVATAFLVLGIPILDAVWVISRRILRGQSPWIADQKHLHHRLLSVGFSQRQAVLVIYGISLIFGLSALFLDSTRDKFTIIIGLLIFMIIVAGVLVYFERRKECAEKASKK